MIWSPWLWTVMNLSEFWKTEQGFWLAYLLLSVFELSRAKTAIAYHRSDICADHPRLISTYADSRCLIKVRICSRCFTNKNRVVVYIYYFIVGNLNRGLWFTFYSLVLHSAKESKVALTMEKLHCLEYYMFHKSSFKSLLFINNSQRNWLTRLLNFVESSPKGWIKHMFNSFESHLWKSLEFL